MSYEIIYNKQFVKLRKTGEVIPMLLMGSNNCYEIGQGGRNGRRSRNWHPTTYYNRKEKISEKPEVILKNLEADLRKHVRRYDGREPYKEKVKPADIRNHWGYYTSLAVGGAHTSETTYDKWYGVFSNGIKHALTIEELDKLGVNLRFYVSSYNNPVNYPKDTLIKTEKDYFIELKKWQEWKAKYDLSFYLSFSLSSTDEVLRRLHAGKPKKTPKQKTVVEQDHYFVLTDGSCGLYKYTPRGFKYSWDKNGGKKYRTEKDAERYRIQLINKGRHKADIWKVERVNNKYSFLVTA